VLCRLDNQRFLNTLLPALESFCACSGVPIRFQDIRALLEHRCKDDADEPLQPQNTPGPSSQDGAPRRPSPREVLEYLLDTVIEQFGYAAGDVYSGMYCFHQVSLRHNLGNMSVVDLREIAWTLVRAMYSASAFQGTFEAMWNSKSISSRFGSRKSL